MKQTSFEHNEIRRENTSYGQSIILMEMETGVVARFTTNFGEVDEEDRAAFFSLRTAALHG